MSDDTPWARFEEALNQHTIRVYDLSSERVHVDSTTASAYTKGLVGIHVISGHSDGRPKI